MTAFFDELIMQSYDRAAVMRGQLSGVQKLIRNEHENLCYVHCYGNKLNLILIRDRTLKSSCIFF